MTSDRFDEQDDENVRALWQGDVSQIARMSADDLHKRVEYLRYQFDSTRWIPWAASVFLVAFFGVMLGAGLLSVPSEGGLRAALLSMAGPCLAGMATAWYLRRQTRQYGRRIQELRRISA